MNSVTRGLVLRSTDYREGDKLLTVLTDTCGKITVKARGARKRNSRLLPVCQLFTWSEMTLFEYQGRYILDDAELLESFSGLQKSLDAIALASYFTEVLSSEGDEDLSSGESLRLVLNCLYALSRGIAKPAKIKAAFELRYISLSGYTPQIRVCTVCGRDPVRPMLALEAGVLHCASCAAPGFGKSLPLDAGSLVAMRYIIASDLKKILSYRIDDTSGELLYNACEAYLLSKLERRFHTLDFYKSVGDTP